MFYKQKYAFQFLFKNTHTLVKAEFCLMHEKQNKNSNEKENMFQ